MSTHKLHHIQQVPATLNEVWSFFSNPQNLSDITPDHMGFNVLSDDIGKMYPGQIIEYKVKPLLGIPLYWMTEITQVNEGDFFIDEQRVGPYTLWHHQHFFREKDHGVEVEDIVHYRLPFGPLGDIAHRLFVRKQLESIFTFRSEFMNKKWP